MVLALLAFTLHVSGSQTRGVPAMKAPPSAAKSAKAAASSIAHRLHVLVTVDPVSASKSDNFTALAGEVREIWRPYADVDLDIVNPVAAVATVAATYDEALRLVITDRLRTHDLADARALGWIEFLAPGRPRHVVTVSTAVAVQLMNEGVWGDRPLKDLPRRIRERFLQRALGRGIAHEIGHYLLRSSVHASRGLMRDRLNAAEIMERAPDDIRLQPAEVERLQRLTSNGVLAEAPAPEPPAEDTAPKPKTTRDRKS
jgi:hypothetical protein